VPFQLPPHPVTCEIEPAGEGRRLINGRESDEIAQVLNAVSDRARLNVDKANAAMLGFTNQIFPREERGGCPPQEAIDNFVYFAHESLGDWVDLGKVPNLAENILICELHFDLDVLDRDRVGYHHFLVRRTDERPIRRTGQRKPIKARGFKHPWADSPPATA
jgi:hypothetical protein